MTDTMLPGMGAPTFYGRLLGRCPAKGCGHVKAVDAERFISRHVADRFGGYTTDVPGYRIPGYEPGDPRQFVERITYHRFVEHTCPTHGHRLRFKPVEGRLAEAVTCNSVCRNAKGPNCDCSCAGAHHGEGHL